MQGCIEMEKQRQHAITNQGLGSSAMTIRRRNKEWRHGMTERAVHQDTMILNVYAANKRTEKQTQQKGTEMKRETDKSSNHSQRLLTVLLTPGREQTETSATVREKGTKTTWHLSNPPTEVERTFSGAHGPFTRMDHILALQNGTTHMKELKPYKTCSLNKTDYTRNQ